MNKIENYELIEAQEEAKVDFAIMLNNLLEEKNISYTELANLAGKSKSLVSRIMGGSNNLTIETMVSMLFALDEKIVISTEAKLQEEYGRVLSITSATPITNLSKRQPYHIGNFRPLVLEI